MTAAIVRASRFVFSQECLVELDHRGARPALLVAPLLLEARRLRVHRRLPQRHHHLLLSLPLVVPRGWRCRNPCLGKALDGTCAVATGSAPGGEGGDQAAAQEAIDGGGT